MKFQVRKSEEEKRDSRKYELKTVKFKTRTIVPVEKEVIKSSAFPDWKVTAVVAAFILAFICLLHAVISGDAWLWEKFLRPIGDVASKVLEVMYVKESG